MKNFNKFAEALLVTSQESESDSVGPVEGQECGSCGPAPQDMLTQAAEETMGSLGDTMQPTDYTGGGGDIDAEGEDGSDVDIECLGEEGVIVKFNGTAILLPKNVYQKIKDYNIDEFIEKVKSVKDGEEEGEEGESDDSESSKDSDDSSESESEESETSEESESEESDDNAESDDSDEDSKYKKKVTPSKAFDINESVKFKMVRSPETDELRRLIIK